VILSRTAFVIAACLLAVLLPEAAAAQHITINRFSRPQTLVGPNYLIGPNLGRQFGGSLFDSIFSLSVPAGQCITFAAPPKVNNIIAGVTGGSPSTINGSIKSNANLYLINPAGIVFGPGAMVKVSGSFYASTADYLKLSNGARFQATHPDGSKLSAASPTAFGFLTAKPPAITVNGSMLTTMHGTIGLVGGPVVIRNGAEIDTAGTIDVASVAGMGEVPVNPRRNSGSTVKNFGRVAIIGKSNMNGGNVFIRSGNLTIDSGTIDENQPRQARLYYRPTDGSFCETAPR
jgi:filamentous hemagglutinin family protein